MKTISIRLEIDVNRSRIQIEKCIELFIEAIKLIKSIKIFTENN